MMITSSDSIYLKINSVWVEEKASFILKSLVFWGCSLSLCVPIAITPSPGDILNGCSQINLAMSPELYMLDVLHWLPLQQKILIPDHYFILTVLAGPRSGLSSRPLLSYPKCFAWSLSPLY